MLKEFILSLIYLTLVNTAPNPTGVYTNKLVLVEPDVYTLYWNFTQNDIVFEIHVKSEANQWTAFGLSPNGHMTGSDIVVIKKNSDGTFNFTDRHILKGNQIKIDSEQNWFPLYNAHQQGYLISKFTRKINLCDKTGVEDMDISQGTPYLIFAWSDNFVNGDISYHGSSNRGAKVAPLISTLNQKVNLNTENLEKVDFRVNTTITSKMTTEYYCQMFKLPADWIKNKRHLVRYETLYTPGTEKYFHHWTINECDSRFETEYLAKKGMPAAGPCYFSDSAENYDVSNEWNKLRALCSKITIAWAVGGQVIQDFPPDMAYPLGGSDKEFKYFYLEMHFDNPEHKEGLKDTSGVRFYVTQNLRPIEFGTLVVGADASPNAITIPPGAERFPIDYYCRKECLDKLYDKTKEIKIFSSMPHTHLKGRELYTTIIRDGKEIGYITNNKYYDFNYQYYNFLTEPIVMKPGDEIKTTCVYSTKDAKNFTFGGESTEEEMCFSFIWYYPRNTGTSYCSESMETEKWSKFYQDLEKTGEIEIKSEFSAETNQTSYSIIPKNVNQQTINKFQDFYNQDRQATCFNGTSWALNKEKLVQPAAIQTVCNVDKSQNIYLSAQPIGGIGNAATLPKSSIILTLILSLIAKFCF